MTREYLDALVKRADYPRYFDHISALRISFPMSLLIEQLTS